MGLWDFVGNLPRRTMRQVPQAEGTGAGNASGSGHRCRKQTAAYWAGFVAVANGSVRHVSESMGMQSLRPFTSPAACGCTPKPASMQPQVSLC